MVFVRPSASSPMDLSVSSDLQRTEIWTRPISGLEVPPGGGEPELNGACGECLLASTRDAWISQSVVPSAFHPGSESLARID